MSETLHQLSAQDAGFVPGMAVEIFADLYRRLDLQARHPLAGNLVISNVVLSAEPTSIQGARVLGYLGAGPLFESQGLLIAALTFNLTACTVLVPDLPRLVDQFEPAVRDLEAALVNGPAEAEDRGRSLVEDRRHLLER